MGQLVEVTGGQWRIRLIRLREREYDHAIQKSIKSDNMFSTVVLKSQNSVKFYVNLPELRYISYF